MHNVFIVGYDEFNLKTLQTLSIAEEIRFLPCLTYEDIKSSEEVPALDLLDRAVAEIEDSPHEPDAITTFWDFPATLLAAFLARRFGVAGPSVRSVFKCENKLWSRNEQRKVIANHIPLYTGFDPHDDDAYAKINLVPPFWIKPVKSFRAFLAFRVNSHADFEQYRARLVEGIDGIYRPFQDLMRRGRIPDMIANGTESCIAESMLSGHLCTVEGYVQDDEVICYGVVDSIREESSSSLSRYQYPSLLPMEIQYRMMDLTRRAVDQIGLTDCCFNVEYFYNQTAESINLLEINPRTSQSHADLFDKVHGTSQYQTVLEIALGQLPRPLRREGRYRVAAKYMVRATEPGVVRSVPDDQRLAEIAERFPGTRVKLHVAEGDDLADLLFQDAYSFELADVYLGADTEIELDDRRREVVELLGIEVG